MRKRLFGSEPHLAREREAAALRGVRAAAPSYVATAVWGVVTGVAMVNLGLSSWQAIGMSLFVYAGSAQLAVLPLIAVAAPVGVILLTAAVVNLRFVIFSAAIYPYFKRFKPFQRLLIGSVNTDLGFALFLSRFAGRPAHERGSNEQVWFFLGVACGTWIVWQITSITGVLIANYVPLDWNLGFAAILALIAMVLPMIVGGPTIVGALVAGVVAVIASGLPLRLGLLAAVVVGVTAAILAEIAFERARSLKAMSGLSLWIVIAGMAVISIITRSFFVVLGDRVPLPERVLLALRYAPACALVALVTPELVLNNGIVDLSPQNFKLMGGLAAVGTMLISRSMIITLAVGMTTYTVLRLL